jgi:hypothetical protein
LLQLEVTARLTPHFQQKLSFGQIEYRIAVVNAFDQPPGIIDGRRPPFDFISPSFQDVDARNWVGPFAIEHGAGLRQIHPIGISARGCRAQRAASGVTGRRRDTAR